jgi:uncharacterized protein with GYD domain
VAQYLVQFNQTSETWGRLIKNPEDRRKVFGAQVEKLGGKLLGYWYTFGKYDGVLIVEMPDNVTMASLLAPIAASGGVHVETTALLTVEEMQSALKKAGAITYNAPGA